MEQDRRGERGQVLVLGALMMTAMLGFLAIVVDAGNAYAQRRFLQNGADAAAIAATRLLANRIDTSTPDGAVVAAVEQYLTANGGGTIALNAGLGADAGAWYITPSGARIAALGSGIIVPAAPIGGFPQVGGQPVAGVEVIAERRFDTFFAGVLGFDEMTVQATATSRFGGLAATVLDPPGAPRVMPMVFDVLTFDLSMALCGGYSGNLITFTRDATDPFLCLGATGDGGFNWSPLNVSASWSNAVAKDLLDPVTPYADNILRVGDTVQVAPGERAVDYRLLADNWRGRDVIVPLVSDTVSLNCPPHGNCSAPVTRFAWFHVVDANGSGPVKWFSGYWVDPRTKDPVVGGGPSTSTSIWGPITFALTR